MSRKVSFDTLYTAFVNLITLTTGVSCWRKMGLQVRPSTQYATIYLSQGPSSANDVVVEEEIEGAGIGEPTVLQQVGGLTRLDCVAEFYKNVRTQPALDAAIAFRNSLQLEERFTDIWKICGLVGEIRTIDVSAMFRADVEGRAEIRFSIYAQIGAPRINEGDSIHEIDTATLNVSEHNTLFRTTVTRNGYRTQYLFDPETGRYITDGSGNKITL